MERSPEQKAAKFLLEASLLYEEKCPELSRFLLQQPFKIKGIEKKNKQTLFKLLQSTSVCLYCYQWLKPGNHRVRLRPKRRPSARVQQVLHRHARGKRLSLIQKKLLLRFQKSPSVLMATCHACSKTSIHKGVNRDFIATFAKTHGTPGSAGKYKTPQSSSRSHTTPKNPGKEKTPSSTPRSSITSTMSGSSTSSAKSSCKSKNWVVQRLSKILTREDSQGKKKGGLKDFLSSL
ncbi:PREDICTED: UPF0711 protein C18orf21 homolog isoform X1 [Cyprinodon variegatus]|uniref:Si:dkey-184p18.2 n=1 Tax=Cyprinodon variegatus TaxID=28743 RepID=A0A3Q2CJE2_CYPVA|nr:PREDICTED: UPF0711 protein C18orf21 homolog isoform X1 [Cyprinodon variegatus]